ncbi:MAG TPA: 30S ribosomal protein S13 [candidate division Zixibacteria bacterium]|nr:30S ribosomal protein S13 [candidate division Zixibacteria bacterium]
MARIAGIDLPKNKRIDVALTYIFGIGYTSSKKILEVTQIDPARRVHELSEGDVSRLRQEIDANYEIEGELRAKRAGDIKRLIEIGSYRGFRHKVGLPVNGQRTRTNARTRKGPKRTVGLGKKATGKKG